MEGAASGQAGALAAGEPHPRFAGPRFIALLIFTQLPAVFGYTIALPLLERMQHALAHGLADAYMAKMVSGVLGPSMAIGAASGGWLADKFDRRWLVMALGALYVAAGMSPYLLDNLEAIVATRFFLGLAAGALLVIGQTMVGDYLPEEKRAGTIGMLSALGLVASVLSLPAAGFVGNAGWRYPFLLYAVAAPVILLASPTSLPVPHKPAIAKAAGGLRRAFALPYALLLLALAVGITLTIPGIYISFHLAALGLGKPATVALLMALNSTIAAVFSAIFGKAVHRFSSRVTFCVGFLTMGSGLVLLAYAPGYAVAIPALLLMGAGMGWLNPGIVERAVESVGEGERGKVVGAVQGASAVAPIVGVTLFEPWLPVIGASGVMLSVGLLSLALFLGFALRRGAPRRAALSQG
jgi:MFS family permease